MDVRKIPKIDSTLPPGGPIRPKRALRSRPAEEIAKVETAIRRLESPLPVPKPFPPDYYLG
jgi:hypothetical protein